HRPGWGPALQAGVTRAWVARATWSTETESAVAVQAVADAAHQVRGGLDLDLHLAILISPHHVRERGDLTHVQQVQPRADLSRLRAVLLRRHRGHQTNRAHQVIAIRDLARQGQVAVWAGENDARAQVHIGAIAGEKLLQEQRGR